MKRFSWVVLFFTIGLIMLLASCSTVSSTAGNISVGLDESLVIVKRNSNYAGSIVNLGIFVDGQLATAVGNGQEVKFTVPNGKHTIKVANLLFKRVQTPEIAFEADSMEITFAAGFDGSGLHLIKSNETELEGRRSQNVKRLAAAPGLEGAVYRASQSLINDIPENATVAVLSISSTNLDTASWAIDELEYQMVNAKMFKMVDRKTLDAVRSEQNFQMSGEVSDESAISIGDMLGASIVVTGSIIGSGNSQRLTLKALDVKTAQIVTMAREQF
jgi:TolB-like protein